MPLRPSSTFLLFVLLMPLLAFQALGQMVPVHYWHFTEPDSLSARERSTLERLDEQAYFFTKSADTLSLHFTGLSLFKSLLDQESGELWLTLEYENGKTADFHFGQAEVAQLLHSHYLHSHLPSISLAMGTPLFRTQNLYGKLEGKGQHSDSLAFPQMTTDLKDHYRYYKQQIRGVVKTARHNHQFDKKKTHRLKKTAQSNKRSTKRLYRNAERKQADFEGMLEGDSYTRLFDKEVWKIDFTGLDSQLAILRFQLAFSPAGWQPSSFAFDTLHAGPIGFLPSFSNSNCVPTDRYTFFKKFNGLNFYPEKWQVNPRDSAKILKEFTVYFEQNQSVVGHAQIGEMLEVLRADNFRIVEASIEAYASVEGWESINLQLQKDRAEAIKQILEQYNQGDSIVFQLHEAEDWELFYKQIEKTPYKEMMDWPREKVKEFLTDPANAALFEFYLSKQRRSILKLKVIQHLDVEEQVGIWGMQFYSKAQFLYQKNKYRAQSIAPHYFRWIGSWLYLINNFDRLSPQAQARLVKYTAQYGDDDFKIMNFYAIKYANEGLPPAFGTLEENLLLAFHAAINMMGGHSDNPYYLSFYFAQAFEIQSFILQKIENSELPVSMLCELEVEENPHLYPFIISQLYFVERGLNEAQRREYSCGDNLAASGEDALSGWGDEFEFPTDQSGNNTNGLSRKALLSMPPMGVKRIIPKQTRYYYFLKKGIVEGKKEMQDLAFRVNEVKEIDIYEFIWFNMQNSDYWHGKFYDADYPPEKLLAFSEEFIGNLKKLCPYQAWEMYLNLLLRTSILVRHDAQYTDLSLRAAQQIQAYYLQHVGELSSQELDAIYRHLVWLNQFGYHKNEMLRLGNQLLEARRATSQLETQKSKR